MTGKARGKEEEEVQCDHTLPMKIHDTIIIIIMISLQGSFSLQLVTISVARGGHGGHK